jgi:hypothetical protein
LGSQEVINILLTIFLSIWLCLYATTGYLSIKCIRPLQQYKANIPIEYNKFIESLSACKNERRFFELLDDNVLHPLKYHYLKDANETLSKSQGYMSISYGDASTAASRWINDFLTYIGAILEFWGGYKKGLAEHRIKPVEDEIKKRHNSGSKVTQAILQ